MMFLTCSRWLRPLRSGVSSRGTRRETSRRRPYRPRCEVLEDRCLPSSYNVVDLGAFSPNAINNVGQLAGAANGDAAEWQNGTITDLGTAGQANDLNDTGQVVTGPSGASSGRFGINSSSQVVGTEIEHNASLGFSSPNAFFWTSSGVAEDINSLLGDAGSEARAINQTGQVVGWTVHYIFIDSFNLIGTGWQALGRNAYLWDSATSTKTALGNLPGDNASKALDVNNFGQVIGTSGNIIGVRYGGYQYFAREGFLWQNGVMTDLGMPNASGINNLGQVVGSHYLWQSGTVTDLNTQIDPTCGWMITSTSDINDNGQIVGRGTLNGVAHSFLLDPVDPSGTVSFAVGGFSSPTTAGAAGSFTVTALDGSGATATGYSGTVYFTSSDPQAALPGVYTFKPADGGVQTFSAALKTAGAQSIMVTDAAHGMSGSEGGITVQATAVSKLAVAGFPSYITAGVTGSFSVTPEDAYGNTVSGYTGTIHFTSSDPQAVLPGDYTFAGNSAQSFSATLKTAGAQSIAATDIVMASLAGSDSGIQVNPAAASRLAITGPSSVTPGTLFSITVTAYDVFGNVATGYAGTVAFKCSDSTATLPPSYTYSAADKGAHTFSGLKLKKKGTQTITVTDVLNPLLTVSLSVNVG